MKLKFIFNVDITVSTGSFKKGQKINLEVYDNDSPKEHTYAVLYREKVISHYSTNTQTPKKIKKEGGK